MSDAIRPITLDEIRAARTRIAGTITAHAAGPARAGPGFPDIRLKLENLQPINSFKLRGAANAVAMLTRRGAQARRLDHQRRQRRTGRRLRRAQGRRPLHRRRHRDGARRQDRAHEGTRRQPGAGAVSGRVEGAGGAHLSRHRGHLRASLRRPQLHRRATPPSASRSSRMRPMSRSSSPPSVAADCITGAGSAIRALRPDVKILCAEPETAAPMSLSLQAGSPQQFPGMAGVVRGWRRREERLPPHVGTDARPDRRQHRRDAGRNQGGPCASWPRRPASSPRAPARCRSPPPSPARPVRDRSSRSSPGGTSTSTSLRSS